MALDPSDTEIGDAGLVHLRGMTRLQLLNLSGTRIRGPGLVHLAEMRSLMMLDLRRPRRMTRAWPPCRGSLKR